MKNRIVKPLWVIVAALGIFPVVGLILSVFYRNLDAFYVSLVAFFLPMFLAFLLLIIFNAVIYFKDKRALRRKNKNSN